MATVFQCDCCGKLMKKRGCSIGNEFRDCCSDCVDAVMALLREKKTFHEAHTPLLGVDVGVWEIK